ncbi:ig-like domain-containing protein [Nephila pilipes]|uniref:Ig-like domain-containing protein n=1 Tax=Nephila pilipes TaxID=299642 RepID=A0A8X6NXK4_NEPPI|nr:ig-like domain-containing protein [Nephila pilipes]
MKKRSDGCCRKRESNATENGEWSIWFKWFCPITCGGGTAERRRFCYTGKGKCKGDEVERKPCATELCPEAKPSRLLAQAKKQIVDNTKSYQLQKGEEITLNCLGGLKSVIQKNYRNFKTIWHHNQEVFHLERERTGLMDKVNLYIARLFPKDNGVWACEAQLDAKLKLFTAVYTLAVENDAPDIEVKTGSSFSIPCNDLRLSKFFETKLIIQWYHNTSLYENGKAGNARELYIRSSKPEDSGIWLCKVNEDKKRLERPPKVWATNVVNVNVLPPGDSIFNNDNLIIAAILLGLVAVISSVIICCVQIRKKSRIQRDEESGKNSKKAYRIHKKTTSKRSPRKRLENRGKYAKKGTKKRPIESRKKQQRGGRR